MKKYKKLLLTTFLFLFPIFLLAGCSAPEDKSKLDLSEERKIFANDVQITPENAKLHDGYLEVTVKWSFGDNEDSMKKETFLTSGVSFTAYQGDNILIFDPENSHGLGNSTYEKSDSTLNLAFKLENKETPVDLKFYRSSLDPKDESVDLTINIKDLETSK